MLSTPSGFSGDQSDEREMRESVAKEQRYSTEEDIIECVSLHHCLPVMSSRANNFRNALKPSMWALDVGCGTGWYWRNTTGSNLILVDFVFDNLMTAKKLLKNDNLVVFIQANAGMLPVRSKMISGVWSVQVTQHLPESVLRSLLKEVTRILKDDFLIEIYNLNPAWLCRAIYSLFGKKFHVKGKFGDKVLNRLNANELKALWKDVAKNSDIKIGYSELLFHPDFHFTPKGKYIEFIERLLSKNTWLSVFFARQIQITLESKKH